MRGKVSIFLIVSLVVSLCALTTLAQAEEKKPQLFVVWEYEVKPSMIEEFEAIVKEMVNQAYLSTYSYPWYIYSTDDFYYYSIQPLENYSDYKENLNAWKKVMKIMASDEKTKAMLNRFGDTYEYMKPWLVYHKPDLSYIPENPRLKPEEEGFIRIYFFYIKGGREQKFEEVCREWVSLYKKYKIKERCNVFVGDIGTDTPFYVLTLSGKSAADFYINNPKTFEISGEESIKLWKKEVALARKRELKNSWYRSGLSYIPKDK